jgi:hypothetical protein
MKKLSLYIFLLLMWSNIGFAFNKYENAMYQGCLGTAQSLGSKRAKQYCRCTTIMIFDKYSITQLERIVEMSTQKQLEIMAFATNYCNRNARAPGD